jgi:hypothetical protein
MARDEGPAPTERGRERSTPHDSSGRSGKQPASPPSWIEDESPIVPLMGRTLQRLGRRARASGPIWVLVALAVSGVFIWRQSRKKLNYEVTVVVRVEDGAIGSNGAALNGGALRAYINEVAFTSANLQALIRKHPREFPKFATDPIAALAHLDENMEVIYADNEFLEERGPNDPPRAARIGIEYNASDPDTAWTMAHELADLMVGSTVAGQKADLEREAAVAAVALQRSQAELAQLVRNSGPNDAPAIAAARDRWRSAQEADVAAQLALRAVIGRQTLRFDIGTPGRKPEPINRTKALISGFVTMLLLMLVAAALLAGAFDPRVLEAEDLAPSGLGLLGRFPRLPAGFPNGEGGGPGRRV